VKLDAKKARLVMELRNAGITDTAVIRAIELTPREQFVLETFRDRAYDNTALPIDEGQTISQPLVVAMMTEALELNDRLKVLEIGTGSGYQTAVLSRLCRRVYTVERHRSLLKQAEARFEALRIRNVTARAGDGWKGWPEQAPFDRIIVTAAADELPPALVEQLAVGGIMVIPVGPSGAQQLLKVERSEEGVRSHAFGDVRFVPLVRADGGGEANGFARNGSAN
jgi:protein-L-isoaspartate(D-aspartate) O-methyltransferase